MNTHASDIDDKKIIYRKKFKVVIEKEIQIEFNLGLVGGLTKDQFLDELRRGGWRVDDMDDIGKYAAHMAATLGDGYCHEVIGRLERKSIYQEPKDDCLSLFEEFSEIVEVELSENN